nr:hypothetical protein [Tanacetum cinerariifolium]
EVPHTEIQAEERVPTPSSDPVPSDLFGVHELDGDEVFVDVTTGENLKQDATVAENKVTTIEDIKVTTAAVATTL